MGEQVGFKAAIEDAGGGGAFVSVPFDVEEKYGKKRVKILATIDGVPYRGTLVRMGKPCHLLLVRKEIRQQIGKQVGDEVQVFLEEDTEPRVVDVPEDFQQALDAEPVANQHFASLSYTHQKEYVSWIMEAKREETRRSRIMKAVDMLKQGKKTR